MGQLNGILWVFGLILIINSEFINAQQKRSSSRITSSRSFGTNVKSSSTSSSSATGVNFDCPEEFGYYPHPNDCTQYYVCVFGGALLESCTGGLMYSHELQTCDWPRNVGCDVIDGGGASIPVTSGGSSSYRDVTPRVPQIKQQVQQSYQQQQHRDRFGPTYSSSTPSIQSKPTIVQQYQPRQQQQQQQQRVIQAHVQTLPPPPELRVAPNPIITSRGQPKPLLDAQEEIAKLYADAHDTLPPVEEEESDRQQRVYRGQPSTVGQVQRDRDGIIHQASINAIPNHGKIGSFAYGAQINQYRLNDDIDNSIDKDRRRRRRKRQVENKTDDAPTTLSVVTNYTNQTATTVIEQEEESTLTSATKDNSYDNKDDSDSSETDSTNDYNDDLETKTPLIDIEDSDTDESSRSTRQLRPQFNSRLNRWQLSSSNYRAVDSNPYQQQSFSFGAFNPYLAPPLSPQLKGIKVNPLEYKSPKNPYGGLSYSITGTTQPPLDPYKPFYQPPTSRPPVFQQPDVLPFLLQSLKEIQQQKKKKQEINNFSYFHLGTDPARPVTPPTKAVPSSHYSQFSTVGGFFNNFDNGHSHNFKPTSEHQPAKVVSQFSINSPQVEITTESNYFQYNILQNQKMKSYYATSTTPIPLTSNFKIVQAPNLSSGTPTVQPPTSSSHSVQTHQFSFTNLTTTPLPVYSKPGSISSNYNLGDIMSGIKGADMELMQPAIMNMFKYFKQTTGPAGHREKAIPSTSTTTGNNEYDYYDEEEEDQRTKKPTPTTKLPKGYESFIKSIPSQSYKTQTKFTLKNTRPTTPQIPDDYYYDEEEDDYRIRHPPSEKPVYMPISETMAPRPVENSTVRYKNPNSVTGYLDVTTRRPIFSSHFQHEGGIPSFINFPSDIFQDLRNQHKTLQTDRPTEPTLTTTPPPTMTPTKAATTTTTRRPYTSTTTRKIYTVRPSRGHSKWKYNKASEATKTERRKRPNVVVTQRPTQLNKEVVNIDSNRVESSSQAPPPPPPPQQSANIFISQQRPKIVENQNQNGNRNYYNTSYETQQQNYDPYYSVYDDEIDLYRDVEYSNQQQQREQQNHQQQIHQQQQPQHQLRGKIPQQQQQVVQQQTEPERQRPTYRPEIITSPQPARETYISKPIQKPLQQENNKPFGNQQSLIYNSDYDEDLIAQIEQDNEYDQPTRSPVREDRFAINAITDRPIVVSSTVDSVDEPFYTSLSSTLGPQSNTDDEQDHFDIPFDPLNGAPPPPQRMPVFVPKVIETDPNDEYSLFDENERTTLATTTSTSTTSTTTPRPITMSTTKSSTTGTTTQPQSQQQFDATQPSLSSKRSNRLSDDGITTTTTTTTSTTKKATPKSVILTFPSNLGLTNHSLKHKSNTDSFLKQSPTEATPSVLLLVQNQAKRESSEASVEIKNQTQLRNVETASDKPDLRQSQENSAETEELENQSVTEYQRKKIQSYIISDIEPQSFKPPVVRTQKTSSTTESTAVNIPLDSSKTQKTFRFSLSQGYKGFSLKSEETRSQAHEHESEEKNSAEIPIYNRSRSRYEKKPSSSDNKEGYEPTTYSPLRSWRFTRTSPISFAKHDSNVLNTGDSDGSQEYESKDNNYNEDFVSSSGSEHTLVTQRSTTEPLQSFTARASLFKDNLSRTYETTGPTKFVSPYKSLETILQEKEDSLKFNSIRSSAAPRYQGSTQPYEHSTQKPFRSYFLITTPPRVLSNTTTSTTPRTTPILVWKFNQTSSVVWPSSTLPTTTSTSSTTIPTTTSTTTTTTTTTPKPTTTTTTSTTTTTTPKPTTPTTTTTSTTSTTTIPEPETLLPNTVAPTSTIRLPSTAFRSKIRQEASNLNPEARSRGRSRYTASFSNALDDEPTTYSPKYRFGAAHFDSTTYSPEIPSYRRRSRPTPTRQAKSTTEREFFLKARKQFADFENESYDRPRSEALIGLSVNKNDNTYTDKPLKYNGQKQTTTTEKVVEITDRSVQYYSKFRTTATPERSLAETIKNAGYLPNSRGKYRDLRFDDEINASVEESSDFSVSSTTPPSTAPTTSTIPMPQPTTLPPRTTTTSTTTTVSTTVPSTTTLSTTTPSTTTQSTTTSSTTESSSPSHPTTTTTIQAISSTTLKSIIPPRASRVNSAIKSSIAAASNRNKALATSSSSSSSLSFAKCADNAPNAKCNEIPSRTNNRVRGGSHSNGAEREQQPATVTNHRGTHPPRTRPTLKPSGTIVSKAQEFVDIYRYPPSRPEPLYPQPTPDKTAAKCRKDVCLLPDCYCGGKEIPADLPVESIPQIVLLTFDDSVNDLNKQLYTDLFEKGRVNPNGCPISATFYVSHEWTDYSQVQNLYSDGHEIASHTVSHSFGEQFSQKKWTREVAGQREILAAYGGVKLSDVRGMRAPFLSVGGNKMFKMLYDSNFTYDSSMPVYENRPPSWPYTLDYKIFHDCMIPPCPTKSYPGVWQVPMVMWQDLNGGRCSMGDACSNPGEADGVYKMIMKNFERHYTTNRAPFGLFYHAAWFTQPHHKEGFIKFLDAINSMPDVWILTNWQALQWVRDPTPISRLNNFQPFQCDYSDRPKRCNNPKVCNLWHKSGVRYMRTCQPCPDIYPWTGKTGIRSSRVDNEIVEES